MAMRRLGVAIYLLVAVATLLPSPPVPLAAGAASPGQILKKLTNFYLQLPIRNDRDGSGVQTVLPSQLQSFSNQYFFVRGSDVVLFTPANGARTSGSQHPRTELREVEASGSLSSWGVSWSSTRTLLFTGAVTRLGSGSQTVVIAQVKAEDSWEPLALRVQGDSGGRYAQVVAWFDDRVESGSAHKLVIADRYQIGTRYSVAIVAGKGKISVSFNGQSKTYDFSRPKSTGCYFKVGNYLQTDKDSEVVLSSLDLVK